MSDRAQQVLQSVFGFADFREGQAEIIHAMIAGDPVLAIMPTGGGKSLCYQIPALAGDGMTVVISPLIALMRDQVRALVALGVEAAALTSGNSEEENTAIAQAVRQGQIKLLYLAPERLGKSQTVELLRKGGVRRIAVDEAHCISQWGHDFRPDYLRIGELQRVLNVPLAAFTATADPQTQSEMITRLFEDQTPRRFLHGFDRPNIHLGFAAKHKPRQQILAFAAARRDQNGIVYCATRAKTETLAAALNDHGARAVFYHGGMDPDARRSVEERFNREDGLIVVATIAFGMGVDKPDIRWVAHADLPKSIEAYYQEIGRAGRDGAPAETLTLFGADDIRLRRNQIDESPAPLPHRQAEHGRLNTLLGLAEAVTCRRQVLLRYFAEETPPCGNCDTCARAPDVFDATIEVQKALSAIYRTGEYFGAGHIIDVLRGISTEKTRARGHDKLPTFSVGAEHGKPYWDNILRQMLGHDLVRPDPERHGALRITDLGVAVIKGEKTLTLRVLETKTATPKAPARALVSDEDAPLLAALKARRTALADAANMPAYIVFSDKTLIEMAQKRPQTLDQMLEVSGVGAKKLDTYGTDFLEVITGTASAPHPTEKRAASLGQTATFDALMQAHDGLINGENGFEKPLSCSKSQIAALLKHRPQNLEQIARLIGDKRAERFGARFVDILRNAP